MRREIDTRDVPYERIELSWAKNRPFTERPAVPSPGDRVFYRRNDWDQDPLLVTVLEVQDPNDKSDPNLWQALRNYHGQLLRDPLGRPLYKLLPDPWPWIRVQWWEEAGKEDVERQGVTREARLRGSPGWLPLNWRDRPVRLPEELVGLDLPPLDPNHGGLAQMW